MIQKKSVIGAAAFFVIMALTVGYFALAADVGGRENPLVTLDYLNRLNPQIQQSIESAVNERVNAELLRINDMLNQAENLIGGLSPGADINIEELVHDQAFIDRIASSIAAQYGLSPGSELDASATRVSVSSGTTIRLAQGSRIMRRGGGAVVNAPSGQAGLINLTTGSVLEPGGSLEENHEYTVTFEAGREITVTADTIFFIWGTFS
jgi:hypothetical protein